MLFNGRLLLRVFIYSFKSLEMPRNHALGLFCILLFAVTAPVQCVLATTVQPLSEEELVEQAETIFLGKCVSIKSEWNEEGTRIYTYITVAPERPLKGGIVPQQVTIRQLGGEVGDIGMRVEGTSVFEEGEETLLFLERGHKGFHRVLGLNQGKFSIETDEASGRKILVRKRLEFVNRGEGRIEKRIITLRSDRKLFLDDFINRIDSVLQKQRRLKRQ
jgi:hypothetical protein